MKPLRFVSVAERELASTTCYYEARSPNLGRRFLKQIQDTVRAIAAHPFAGHSFRGDTRRRMLNRFPFAVLYPVTPEEILILAVMDLMRDPEYWVNRL